MYGQTNETRKIFQKTFINENSTKIDEEVNDFIEKNDVSFTQSHFSEGIHVRILFYKKWLRKWLNMKK